MVRIDFRSTTVADESAIRALLQQAHGAARAHPMFERRHLQWKYWQPRQGWQGSRSYVLTRNGEIIAHAAVVPAVCSSVTDRLKLLHVIDWAASADTRGAGNTLMQHIGTLAVRWQTRSSPPRVTMRRCACCRSSDLRNPTPW
jgi:hypothetical protein